MNVHQAGAGRQRERKENFSKGMLLGVTASVILEARTKMVCKLFSWNKACAITSSSRMLNHHGQLLKIIDLKRMELHVSVAMFPTDWWSV